MARKKKPEEPENHERWMVSYADFVTLLFAFFTCLYAISSVDAGKMSQMVASMKVSFGGQIFDGGSRTLSLDDRGGGGGATGLSEMLINPEFDTEEGGTSKTRTQSRVVLRGDADMGRFKRILEGMLSEEIQKNMVRVHLERRGIVISISDNGNFDSGSAEIRPDCIVMLDTIATSLTTIGNQLRIEGHADNVPINTARFPSNMELSTARSQAVWYRMVANHGMSPSDVSVSGYGEWRPVASNDTSEGRARNRRVDIIVLDPMEARVEPL